MRYKKNEDLQLLLEFYFYFSSFHIRFQPFIIVWKTLEKTHFSDKNRNFSNKVLQWKGARLIVRRQFTFIWSKAA